MRHAGLMEKPRRRAAGRPAGPPDAAPEPVVGSSAAPATGPSSPAAPDAPGESPTGHGPASQTGQQHRRRQRATRQPGSRTEPPTAHTTPDAPEKAREKAPEPTRAQGNRQPPHPSRDDRRRGDSSVERSLRALVSTRTTQLPPDIAMRAREVAAPTHADLVAAEQELVIVRRYYVPPAPLATAGKSADPRATEKRPPEGRSRGTEAKRAGRRPPQGRAD
jgi:hypothetical protein